MAVMELQDQALRQYYQLRADEYEQIYKRDDPVRQAEQLELAAAVGRTCLNRRVLEIACGTGYWTQVADRVAQQITALDASAEAVLELAAAKQLGRTTFVQGDAYAPTISPASATAGLALFWLSHVPRAQRAAFLDTFHQQLAPGASVLLADNQLCRAWAASFRSRMNTAIPSSAASCRTAPSTAFSKTISPNPNSGRCWLLTPPRSSISSGRCFWWAEYSLASNNRGQQP